MPEKTILLVEDNADERSIYATVLRHHGYRVLETWNGEDAIRIARQSHPDLVVLDIRLPSISGLTVSQVLRSSRVTSGIPILAISAAAPDPDVLEEVGCSMFLPKPIPSATLVREVERLVGPEPIAAG